MHYFIYATKDATIYTGSRSYGGRYDFEQNTGLDQILELDKRLKPNYNDDSTSRILLHFDTTVYENLVKTNVFQNFSTSTKYYLNLYDASSTDLPLSQTVYAYPVTSSWEMGVGKLHDTPFQTDGVTYLWRDVSGSNSWVTAGGDYTSSFDSRNMESSVLLEYETNDVRMDVSNIVYEWVEEAYLDGGYIEEGYLTIPLPNNGIIVKRSDAQESDSINYGNLKYFSRDTNTIYPPKLEACWDDSLWNTGSSDMTEIPADSYVVYLKDSDITYKETSKARFRVSARDKYHKASATIGTQKVFNNYYLPSGSCYYSIKDAKTDEVIIDFDNYTKLSADSTSNYFDLWMNGLQPERYYKILFKIEHSNGLIRYFDNDYTFKVVR